MSIRVKQHDVTDCGAACISSIASYYKLHLPVLQIRQMASTNRRGTSVMGLVDALHKLGFDAKGVKGHFQALFEIPKPAIAHLALATGMHHYVVIYGASRSFIEIMDPGDGKIHRCSHEEFKKLWSGVLVLLLPGKTFESGNHKKPIASRFWNLMVPHRTMMVQALAGALVFTLIGLSTSIYVQKIIDYVLIDNNGNLLNMMSVVMISLLAIQTFIGFTKSFLTLNTGQLMDAQLILGYYKHLIRLPLSFFDTMRIGEITSRIGDAVKIRAFINDIAVSLAVNIFIVILSFALMFTYYWKLALIILLIIPVYTAIYHITNNLNRRSERLLMERAADLESGLVESLSAITTIKSFGIENFADHKTEVRFLNLLKSVYQSGSNAIYSNGLSEFFARLFTIILLWAGAGFALHNEITPGELLSFYSLVGYFTGPASSMIGMNKIIQNAVIAAERLFEIMDLQRERNESQVALTRQQLGDITFNKVGFSYPASGAVFTDFDLHIPIGKITALVGESGCGKSTLISIIQNLYPVERGNIFIGECNLKYVENNSLRRLISVVPQKIDLFAGNIVNNIALGDPTPDMGRVIEICSSLHLLDFIENLPKGFESYVGENGSLLSGGQKQRIAIARALYRDPEILILDEATSCLDPEAEHYVQQAIELMKIKKKTVIIVAHRLSTVACADKIAVLHRGRVVEEGEHSKLLNNKGYYFKLWRQQYAVVEGVI